MTTPPPSPFGLGWARPLAEMSAPPGTTLREQFDRQLLVGIVATSATFFGVSSLVFAPLATLQETASALAAGAIQLAMLVAFLARGGRLATYAHGFLAMGFVIPVAGGVLTTGASSWVTLTWVLVYPLTAALLTGARGGIAWTVISLCALAAVAWVQTTKALGEPWLNSPYAEEPAALAVGLGSVAVFQMLAVTWFIQQRAIVEGLLARERAAAEALLRNVLPASVAERLERGEVVADHVDEVTIVFADLVGFTTLAAGLPARRVVAMLAEVFGAIDRIADEEGMEKVKTIGDCYMAVSGAPTPCDDHAERALRFACRVRDRINGWEHFGTPLGVRVGVHSGPAMAGILGDKRILYDLWGDTVNAASRLESGGEPGRVQASDTTLRLAGPGWRVEDRGEVPLKGRGAIRACFVNGPADGGDGVRSPNV